MNTQTTNSQQILINALHGNVQFLVLNLTDFSLRLESEIYAEIKSHYLKSTNPIDIELFEDYLRTNSDSVANYYKRFLMDKIPDTSLIEERYKILKTEDFWVNIDENIEEFVKTSRNRDLPKFKEYYQRFSIPITDLNKPKDIRLTKMETKESALIEPFISSMRENGFYFSGLNIIGAGSGAGKSIFAMQQALYTYKKLKQSVTYFSLEMSESAMLGRMFSSVTDTPYNQVYGNADMDNTINYWKLQYFNEENIFFNIDCNSYTPESLISAIIDEVNKGTSLVVVDYLQIISFTGKSEDWKELASLVKELHKLTIAYGITIISPVQVNLKDFTAVGNQAYISVRGSAELINSATSFLLGVQDADAPKETPLIKMFTIKARNAKKSLYVLKNDFYKMQYTDLFTVLD